jgi:F420-dependent oxidoreductase-like protein
MLQEFRLNTGQTELSEMQMRIGLVVSGSETLDEIIQLGKNAESRGFDSLWMANIFGLDAIGTLALVGHATDRIRLGTAVTPTYPRHPTAIAQQALTTGLAAGGRFSLGIGLSHKVVIENMLGMSYDKPARHMREYLSILAPLLRGESVTFSGEQYTVKNFSLDFPGKQPVPLLVAALGPVMLKLAGELTDGTITWMTGPATLESHVIPSINRAAHAAGKGDAIIAAGIPIVLTDDADGAKENIAKALQGYGMLPSYRSMLDKEGAEGPADISIVGDETACRTGIQRLRDAGVTDFNAAITARDVDEHQRTMDFLTSELA